MTYFIHGYYEQAEIYTFICIYHYNKLWVVKFCRYINGTRLDDRIIRCDWDAGFIEGRQYGRGKTGGQVTFIIILFTYLRIRDYYITHQMNWWSKKYP